MTICLLMVHRCFCKLPSEWPWLGLYGLQSLKHFLFGYFQEKKCREVTLNSPGVRREGRVNGRKDKGVLRARTLVTAGEDHEERMRVELPLGLSMPGSLLSQLSNNWSALLFPSLWVSWEKQIFAPSLSELAACKKCTTQAQVIKNVLMINV